MGGNEKDTEIHLCKLDPFQYISSCKTHLSMNFFNCI